MVKKLGAFVLLFGLGWIIARAADRIVTNPRPEAHLRQLFPGAGAFSPLSGNPLHFSVYAADPRVNPTARPTGFAFWTTDVVPQEHGYHGPIHILVGMDLAGTLTGVIVDHDTEPYGYFSVEPTKFAAQFKGKSIHDPFRVGGDIDAVSRASLSVASATRAIRDSSRIMAKQLLPDTVK